MIIEQLEPKSLKKNVGKKLYYAIVTLMDLALHTLSYTFIRQLNKGFNYYESTFTLNFLQQVVFTGLLRQLKLKTNLCYFSSFVQFSLKFKLVNFTQASAKFMKKSKSALFDF